MKTIRLIALDLDGTTLEPNKTIAPDTLEAIREAQVAGAEIVLVTGRSWRQTQQYYQQLGLTGGAILYMGALTVRGASGQVHAYRPLPTAVWQALRTFALTHALAFTACTATDRAVAYGALPAQDLIAVDLAFANREPHDFSDWPGWNPYTEMDPELVRPGDGPVMVAVYGAEAVGRVLAAYPDGIPGTTFDLSDRVRNEMVLHIFAEGVGKLPTLQRYAAERGYQQDEIMACGDMPMDAGMIRWARIGVAMPDGHPAILPEADWVCRPAEAIRRALRGERP
jgi:hydroxymethylpyrimidine pyrophosphatase-like HAD family hydrolase